MRLPHLSLPFVAIVIALFAGAVPPASGSVKLGIDVLEESNFAALRGKRVGLITNQTGVNSAGLRTRQVLARAKNVNLVALFTPEHGLDGTEGAGKYVSSRKDKLTGLTAHSLYGPTRKPTPAMLRGIDALVFDLQDIGSRNYTYVSTMGLCMEAAGEAGIEFLVLDRPNPLGGQRVEGPGIEKQWISFIGQFPVPHVHGLTAGELGRMANNRGWLGAKCKLTVIPMQGWTRDMTWSDTGLRWVQTSPNIPRSTSPAYYAATGVAGALKGVELGIGSAVPFEVIGSKWTDAAAFTRSMSAAGLPGIRFSPWRHSPFSGSQLYIDPRSSANLAAVNVYAISEINRKARPSLFTLTGKGLDIFFKGYGSTSIRTSIEKRTSPSQIIAGWAAGVERFRGERASHLLY